MPPQRGVSNGLTRYRAVDGLPTVTMMGVMVLADLDRLCIDFHRYCGRSSFVSLTHHANGVIVVNTPVLQLGEYDDAGHLLRHMRAALCLRAELKLGAPVDADTSYTDLLARVDALEAMLPG